MNQIIKSLFAVGLFVNTTYCMERQNMFDVLQSQANDLEKFTTVTKMFAQMSEEEQQASVHLKNAEGETLLLVAIENNRYPFIALLLLQQGANPNVGSNKYRGQTSLHKLVGAKGNDCSIDQNQIFSADTMTLDLLKIMIEQYHADLGVQEHLCNRTPVHIAAQQASLEIVKFVVAKLVVQNRISLLFQQDMHHRDVLKFAEEGVNVRHVQTQDVVDFLEDLNKYHDQDLDIFAAILASLSEEAYEAMIAWRWSQCRPWNICSA